MVRCTLPMLGTGRSCRSHSSRSKKHDSLYTSMGSQFEFIPRTFAAGRHDVDRPRCLLTRSCLRRSPPRMSIRGEVPNRRRQAASNSSGSDVHPRSAWRVEDAAVRQGEPSISPRSDRRTRSSSCHEDIAGSDDRRVRKHFAVIGKDPQPRNDREFVGFRVHK